MTIKLAKLFGNTTKNGLLGMPSTEPNIKQLTSTMHPNPESPYESSANKKRPTNLKPQKEQQYSEQNDRQFTFNPYMNEMEDDNMSLYSTSASLMMMDRDHPFNNSQRPLLAERKPQLLFQLTNSNSNSNSNKRNNNINSNGTNTGTGKQHNNGNGKGGNGGSGAGGTGCTGGGGGKMKKYKYQNAGNQEQNRQRHRQWHDRDMSEKNEHDDGYQALSSCVSPYAQQQKRDSAKGLHGFNDFDILSRQYNAMHSESPHIGYPYGSPPSPHHTTIVFDPPLVNATQPFSHVNKYGSMLISEVVNNGANDNNIDGANRADDDNHNVVVGNRIESDAINKFSRFEDDFCNRRNMKFACNNNQTTTKCNMIPTFEVNRQELQTGPFIFGVPPEQQTIFKGQSTIPTTNSTKTDHADDAEPAADAKLNSNGIIGITGINDNCMKKNLNTHTNNSEEEENSVTPDDTSSASNDNCLRERNGACKFLLKKYRRTKKTMKENKLSKLIEKTSIKCVVVGDCAVGKTNLILSYLENRFNPEHIPTASDIYNADVMVDDNPVHLTLCDTAGQDTLDPLRELCYPDSDVFLLCFSVAKPETFHAIKTKWAPKFTKTRAALILVGTQADLRYDTNVLNKLQSNGEKPISYADAWDLATTISAKYIETSSATQYKVKELFDAAIWDGLVPARCVTATPPPPPPPPPTPSLWKKLFCMV